MLWSKCVTRKHDGLSVYKKQEDVGIREDLGSDERKVSVMNGDSMGAATELLVRMWREFFRK